MNNIRLCWISLSFLLAIPHCIQSQHWANVAGGFDNQVQRLIPDTLSDRLYAVGAFTTASGISVHYSAHPVILWLLASVSFLWK